MRIRSVARAIRQNENWKYRALQATLLAAALLLAVPAHAQVCRDNLAGSSSGNGFTIDCDMEYKNTELSCDLYSVYPSCPADPMPMKDTPKRSFIKDFSPYLYTYARDPEDKARPYVGPFALGSPGDQQRTFQITAKPPRKTSAKLACHSLLRFPSDPKDVGEEARMNRLQLDNCASEYILNTALFPYQKENPTMLSMEDPSNRGKRVSLKSHCQPLRTTGDMRNEYLASEYLKAAWIKLLRDPSYRKTPGAKGEPHLPTGVELEQTVSWCENKNDFSCPFPEVRVSSIGAVPFEEINDPTHPFSPRWDYTNNDREEFSPKVAKAGYQSKTDNAVYCAGVKQAQSSEEGRTKEDQEVKVDILEFRRSAFEKALDNRIGYNQACFKDRNSGSATVPLALPPYVAPNHPQFLAMKKGAYCYKITRPFIPTTPYTTGYEGEAERLPCWECFGHQEGKQVDDEGSLPPCTTRHDGEDQSFSSSQYLAGGKNGLQRKALCSTDSVRHPEYDIKRVCSDLRAPYTPLNKLKMRYHNPDKPELNALKEGVQEGFEHKPYFGNHMPYPRLWDTGTSIQRSGQIDKQDPYDTHGQYVGIVGVGHEASVGESTATTSDRQGKANTLKQQDMRCLYGGWGEDQSFGGLNIKLPDPVTSWTEVKLYQARTTRDLNLVCLGRYEKASKIGSTENLLLGKLGAAWVRGIITEVNADGSTTNRTLAEDRAAGGASNNGNHRITQSQNQAWPLAWRGYTTAKKDSQRFPAFGGEAKSIITGLDNAQPGDIILLEQGGAKQGDKPGLPRLGIVHTANVGDASKCKKRKNCYVKVEEFDNGKWPDVCGTTDNWGDRKERTLYAPGMLDTNAKATYERIKTSPSCDNISVSACEMGEWDKVKLYRVRLDVRKGRAAETGGTP